MSAAASAFPRGGASEAEKRLTLAAAILGSFVVAIDSTVVNVALPSVSRDLGGGLAGQQWVVNAYLLLLASLILIGGSLGDLLGARRVFRVGVAGFGVVSALCAAAPTIEVLVVARGLQGVFGALLTPTALAVIISAFPRSERGGAIGTWTAWIGIGAVVGPLVGGQIVDTTSWRVIFALNVPFVVATLLLSERIPEAVARPGPRPRVDAVGATLAALGLAGPTLALIAQPRLGWGDPLVAGSLAGGLALLAAFVAWEARHPAPMLPLGLFRNRNFAVGNVQTLAMYAGLGGTFFFLVLFLQQVAGYSALEAGLATLPTTVVMFALSKRFGALADRLGARPFMGGGPLVTAAGLLLLSRLGADVDYATELLPGIAVFSLGLALTVAPLTATVLAAADESNAGIASAANNAVARVAGLLATAGLGAIVATQFAGALDDDLRGAALSPPAQAAVERAERQPLAQVAVPPGVPPVEARRVAAASRAASVDAFRLAMGLCAAFVALGGVLGFAGIRDDPRHRRCEVQAEECPGGQLAGAPRHAARETEPQRLAA